MGRKQDMPTAAKIGISLCYEPRPSARRLPARRAPQNSARSAEFCTSASPTRH
uniref:Candidate secreted effector n=1 Tax=Meloidogyne incognita TaxID=6306 RepID=A0A914NIQ6_MELIC